MGARGPQRDPNSRRGQQEIKRRQKIAVLESIPDSPAVSDNYTPNEGVQQVLPTCPKGIPRNVAEMWVSLVTDLAAAKVPIKQIDSYAITMAARCLVGVSEAEEMFGDGTLEPEQRLAALRLKAAFSKDLQQWLQIICATPGSRARIGIKGAPEKKSGPLAQILAAKLKGK